MSEEKKTTKTPKTIILSRLRNAGEVFVLLSGCTRLPYVICDPETFDDEILLYWSEEEAKEAGRRLLKEQNPVMVVKLENQQFLTFYSTLFTMGINAIAIDKWKEEETIVQLAELVKRPDGSSMGEGKAFVENPQLQLTAMYLMQEVRRQKAAEFTGELKELQEEMLADLRKGKFLIAVGKNSGIAMLKDKNEDSFQPIFTDAVEFQKFNKDKEFLTAVMDYEKISSMLSSEAKGVVMNPAGINIPFQVTKQNPQREEKKEDRRNG